jgi:hypothetical protein
MTEAVPWFPSGLRRYANDAAELRAAWCYVVLEEIVDGVALLLRWPWPLADEKGRLFWRPDDDLDVESACIPVGALQEQLYRANKVQRAPRVGDTFAAPRRDSGGWNEPGTVPDVRALFPYEVLDVSADARMAARLAYQGSLVTPLPRTEMDAGLVREAAAERSQLRPRPLRTDQAPTVPRGGGG